MYHEKGKQCEEAIASWWVELSKCAQPNNTMEMEVEAWLVGVGEYSREVFKGVSTQGWREEEVQRTCAKLDKEGLKRGMDRRKMGLI